MVYENKTKEGVSLKIKTGWSLAAAFLISLSMTQTAFAHGGEEARMSLEPDNNAIATAGPQTFQFQIYDTQDKAIITDQDLAITHEKILHLVIYDSSLNEFYHLHPEFVNGLWTVPTNISRNGKYWIWIQGSLKKDSTDFSSSYTVDITGGATAWPTPATLADNRQGNDGSSVLSLSATKLRAGKSAMLDMTFSRNDGTMPAITPYLGAVAHVIGVPSDADSLVHVHPMAGGKPDKAMLHVTFPEAGLYRLWIQYMDGGSLRLIPLAVNVSK